MRALLVKLLAFTLPWFAVLTGAEWRARSLPDSYTIKKENLDERLDSVRVLVFGTSHIASGIDPDAFGASGFNLANASQSLYYDVQLLRLYERRMPHLEAVVFGMSHHSLEYRLSESVENWRQYRYSQVFGVPLENFALPELKRYSVLVLKGRSSVLRTNRDQVPVKDNGWVAYEMHEDTEGGLTAEYAAKRLQMQVAALRADEASANLRRLDEAVRALRARGIRVVFVTPPVSAEFARLTDPERMGRMQEAVRSLCATYGAQYIDYSSDARFTAVDFADSDHLNAGGAWKFSRIVWEEALDGASWSARAE